MLSSFPRNPRFRSLLSALQRGANRRRNGRSRYQATTATAIEHLEDRSLLSTITVNSLSDGIADDGVVTLREAVEAANFDQEVGDAPAGLGADTIRFSPSLQGSIVLTEGQLEIFDDVTIAGPGANILTVDADGKSRHLLNYEGVTTKVTGLSLTGGLMSGSQDAGGAILNLGTLTLEEMQIHGNSAVRIGGGVASEGNLAVRRSTISNNSANFGGGIYFNDFDTSSVSPTLTLENSTVSGNTAIVGGGGGMTIANATANIVNSTIAFNENTNDRFGAGIWLSNTATMIENTIVSDNVNETGGRDLRGDVEEIWNSVVETNADFAIAVRGGQNYFGFDPKLLALAAYGGPTMTHAVAIDSVAINHGDNNRAPNVDQRGAGRPQPVGGTVDIGAFEIDPTFVAPYVVDSTAVDDDGDYSVGNLSLREAVQLANDNPGKDRIQFSDDLDAREIRMHIGGTMRQLHLTDDVDIVGPGSDRLSLVGLTSGAIAFGGTADRLFQVDAGITVSLTGLTLMHGSGRVGEGGGAIHNAGELTLQDVQLTGNFHYLGNQSNTGGALYNSPVGTVEFFDSLVESSSSSVSGGGIHNEGVMRIYDTQIRDNVSGSQSSFGVGGGIRNDGTLEIHRSVVSSNSAANHGGGIANIEGASLLVVDSTIDANETVDASGRGGGIYNQFALLNIRRSMISNNTAQDNGGGLFNKSPAFATNRIEVSTFSGNRAFNEAGGIQHDSGAMTLSNVTITQNRGAFAGGVNNYGTLQLGNTIVIGNTSDNRYAGARIDDALGIPFGAQGRVVESLGRNIIGFRHGLFDNAVEPDLDGFTATQVLDPVARNIGGLTDGHILIPGSPAIDNGNDSLSPFLDQRGAKVIRQDAANSRAVDIGAYEFQMASVSEWDSEVNDASQFGTGQALVHGFGFDDGNPSSNVRSEPMFIGIPFDTGPKAYGAIETGPFGDKWGGEIRYDLSGRLGFDVGFYVNSGSVDVNYDGDATFIIDDLGGGDMKLTPLLNIDSGSFYTVSPKVGAYVDLVVDIDAQIGATACAIWCAEGDIPLRVDEKLELFSLNRQELDKDDIDNDGDTREPLFIDPNSATNERTTNPVGAAPAFDGDVRFAFQALIEDLTDAADNARTANKLKQADDDERRGNIDIEEGRRELENAKTESERTAAQDKIRDGGTKVDSAKASRAEVAEQMAKRTYGGGTGLVVSFGEAEGNLLGAEASIGIGAGVDGVAGAKLELGTVAVTIPDVNLTDVDVDGQGKLSATTDEFVIDSDLDLKRQLAKVSVDMAALVGPYLGIPAGKYSANLGPLDVEVQTVSYNMVPKLNVTQDVDVTPTIKQLQYEFYVPGTDTLQAVDVEVDGQLMSGVTTVAFNPGSDVILKTGGVAVEIVPAMKVANTLSNDIGLELDLTGALEAFAFKLSAFGYDLIDIPPLVTHTQRFLRESLGDVFSRDFDIVGLNADGNEMIDTDGRGLVRDFSQKMAPIMVGAATMDGSAPGSALPANPSASLTASPDEFSFFQSEIRETTETASGDGVVRTTRVFQDVGYSATRVDSIVVLTDGITLDVPGQTPVELSAATPFEIPGGTTAFTLRGFGSRTTESVVGLKFAVAGVSSINAFPANPIELSSLQRSEDSDNTGGVDEDAFDLVGASTILTVDVDGDGTSSPLSDAVVLARYISGFRGPALIQGAVSQDAKRTTPEEIARYIEDVIDQSRAVFDSNGDFQIDPNTGNPIRKRTLDLDDDGVVSTLGDGIMLMRHLAGFTGNAMTQGAISSSANRNSAQIREFIDHGRDSTNKKAVSLFDENGMMTVHTGQGFDDAEPDNDRFGLKQRQSVDDGAVDGSSAAAPKEAMEPSAGGPAAMSVLAATANPTYMFDLDTYNSTIIYEATYLDSVSSQNLVSLAAAGSPAPIPDHPEVTQVLGSMDRAEIDALNARLIRHNETKTLGVDQPIFVEVPDAASYEYRAAGGYKFTSVMFDDATGGNVYLDSQFDLYVPNGADWRYAGTITASDGVGLGAGFEKFRLVGQALPNQTIHRDLNEDAPGTSRQSDGTITYNLPTTMGFTLAGGTGTPIITLEQIAARESIATPDAIDQDCDFTNCAAADGFDAQFTVVRDGANAVVEVRNINSDSLGGLLRTVATEPLASSTELTFDGDYHRDVVMIDTSDGPVRLPIVFEAFDGSGFIDSKMDTLAINGANATIDLVNRDSINDVEFIDIRGNGTNTLIVDANVVRSNRGTDRTLAVILNADDVIEMGDGWVQSSTPVTKTFIDTISFTENSIDFFEFKQAGATLLVADPNSVPAAGPVAASGTDIAEPSFAAVNVDESSANFESNATALRSSSPPIGSQVITPVPANQTVEPGDTVSVQVDYSVFGTNQTKTTGLNLRMHFDGNTMSLRSVAPRLSDGFSSQQTFADDEDFDNDPTTTHYLNMLWVDTAADWPSPTNTSLFTAHFDTTSNFQSATINFTAQTAVDYDLDATSATIGSLGFSVTETGGVTQVSELGNRDTFEVRLNTQPSSNVVIDVVTSDPTEVVSQTSRLTFTPSNWDTVQTVFAQGVDDDVLDGTTTSHFRFRINDALSAAEFASVTDHVRFIDTLDYEDNVTIAGTPGDDTFTFTASTPHVIRLNGVNYEFRSNYPIVRFDGLSGRDSITLRGDASNDTATLRTTSANIRSPNYNVASANSEVHRIYGNGGINRVDAYGSDGDDVAILKPQHMWITAGASYGFAEGFQTVVAHPTPGYDQAQFYDTAGDEHLIHKPSYSSIAGDGFQLFANGFEAARAWATDGNDTAEFFDSSGDDSFVAKPDFAYMVSGSLYRYTSGFDTTTAWSNAGGNDAAQLYDSAANDILVSRYNHTYLVAGMIENHVRNFETVRAFSTAGGFDEAQFYDSPGNDQFTAKPGVSSLENRTSSFNFLNEQNGFDKVGAFKTKAGEDLLDQYSGLDYMFTRLGDWDVSGF